MVSIRDELYRYNPWWADIADMEKDEHIRRFRSNPIKWMGDVSVRRGEILVLRGPRQVGKTTLMKRKIEALLREGKTTPQGICYFSCDLISTKEELYSYIREFLDFSELYKPPERWLFVDEISFIGDWPLAIKRLKDSGELADAHVFLTGSNSADLKRGAERLPGRGIEGNEYFAYPLAFGEYLSVVGAGSVRPFADSPFDFFRGKQVDEKVYARFRQLEARMPRLGIHFGRYAKTGGFLKAINEFEAGRQPEEETYLRWIERDISVLGRDLHSARQVLRAVFEKQCSPTSMLSIAKQTDIASHNTVREYVTLLEELQVLSVYGCFDRSEKRIAARKDKKLHFLDPFIATSLAGWTGARIAEPCLIEGMAAEHMRRSANQAGLAFGYYKDPRSEVDIILEREGVLLPIEIKWQDSITPADFKGLYRFGFGILATKASLGVRDGRYLVIPLAMLLAALDIKALQRLRYGKGSQGK